MVISTMDNTQGRGGPFDKTFKAMEEQALWMVAMISALQAVRQYDASNFLQSPEGEKAKRAAWRGVMRKVNKACKIPSSQGEEQHQGKQKM